MTLTSAFQLVPEQSTAAIVVHHPEAKYYAVRGEGAVAAPAEAVASWMHQRQRRELGIGEERGKRYSWGYGACPDLEDHAQLFKILPASEALGMVLTSSGQLVPEQSTAAIVVHHPEAKYYAVRGEGEVMGARAAEVV